jgi:hypothetical protein
MVRLAQQHMVGRNQALHVLTSFTYGSRYLARALNATPLQWAVEAGLTRVRFESEGRKAS